MGTFTVQFKFKENDDKILDFLIDWYVRRGMDCTAGVGGDGTGSADIDQKYLAAFCMIDKLCITSVKWDKNGITAWRPKRKAKALPLRSRTIRQAQRSARRKQVSVAKAA